MNNSSVRFWSRNTKKQTRKGKRLRKKVKYELVEFNSLPGYLKDNEYIRAYYRANWPLKQTFWSMFSLHNETINIWTHLIGFFIFLSLTIYTAKEIPNFHLQSFQNLADIFKSSDLNKMHSLLLTCLPSFPHISKLYDLRHELKESLPLIDMIRFFSGFNVLELLSNCLTEHFSGSNHTHISKMNNLASTITPLVRQPITRWPFFAYLFGATFCLLASTTCHLFCCHSERVSYIMLRIDYIGIASLISTSFYPVSYYAFICHHPFFCYLYIISITILALATVLFSLFPGFQKPELRILRAILFSGMGLLAILPIAHKNFIFWGEPIVRETSPFEILMGVSYAIGALVYATRIPERWMPGKFDIAGHSHQLFHVLVVLGAYSHYKAALVYLKWRDLQGC